jgi:hypothetical protein
MNYIYKTILIYISLSFIVLVSSFLYPHKVCPDVYINDLPVGTCIYQQPDMTLIITIYELWVTISFIIGIIIILIESIHFVYLKFRGSKSEIRFINIGFTIIALSIISFIVDMFMTRRW